MKEDYLHYIWKLKKWNGDLFTVNGKAVKVLSVGFQNKDAGPDFFNAKLLIDDILWVGNVEIHVKSSDWISHGHSKDDSYKNIILHVVYINDLDYELGNFPTMEVKRNISESLLDNFQLFKNSYQFIPCEDKFKSVDKFIKSLFYESLYIERLNRKSSFWKNRLQLLNGDWEALLFESLAYGFGLKINAYSFHILSKSFDFKIIKEIKRKEENLESLLFGQAGFLKEASDEYHSNLKLNYRFLAHKYHLNSVENHLFKFLRLRPQNFPTIRLAQLAAMYEKSPSWFSLLVESNDFNLIQKELSNIKASNYWDNHFTFGKESQKCVIKRLSKSFINLLYINVVIPIKFLYFTETGKNIDDLLEFTTQLDVEKNSIISNFNKIESQKLNMREGQALIELKNNFCDTKKCLHCRIGNQILK